MPRESTDIYEFGTFRLDVAERRIDRSDQNTSATLPEKAFQTLVYLVRNSGTLVPKDELLSVIWPNTNVEENNLGKAIHAIRRFLGEKSREYIETVPKHGYRFVAPVVKVSTGNGIRDVRTQSRLAGVSSPAWDLYLRGKVKAAGENKEDTEAAIEVLERAIALDPKLAGAYAQLARVYNTIAFKFSSDEVAKQRYEDAEVAILKALVIDPNLAEAHFARGLILWTKRKGFPHEQAIKSYKRSLELDPHEDETLHQLSMVYSHIGLIDEALQSVHQALYLNPNNTMARFRSGLYEAYRGRFDDALSVFKTIPRETSPMLVDRCIADVLVQQEKLEEAGQITDRYLKEYPRDEGGSFTSVKAVILAKKKNQRAAEKAIHRATEIGIGFGHFHHTAHNIAAAYTALGNHDAAIRSLENAANDGFPNFTYFQIDPNLDRLRGDERFVKFMGKLKSQWEHFKQVADT